MYRSVNRAMWLGGYDGMGMIRCWSNKQLLSGEITLLIACVNVCAVLRLLCNVCATSQSNDLL